MNTSFSKKFKTAAKMMNVPIILLIIFMDLMCMTSGLLNEPNSQDIALDITTGFSLGGFGTLSIMTIANGMFFSFINHLKVLPFTKSDIKSIAVINIFLNIFIFTIVQCVISAFMRPSAIPYFICINIVNIALSMGYLLMCFRDKKMWNTRAAMEDPMTRSQSAKLLISIIIVMILAMALTVFIYTMAVRGSLTDDMPVLIGISAAAVIIAAVEIILYKKKKIEF